MGGNALKTIETHRLDAKDYHALVPVVLDKIASVVGRDRGLAVVEAYRTKPSFGDMDVLVVSDGLPPSYKDDLARVFRSREFFSDENSIVTSFDHEGFQVDVIEIAQQSFEFAKGYHAFNDLGNLMGVTARQMGLRLGFNCLYLPMADGENIYERVPVTRDFDSAIKTLGYDPARYRQGFDTIQEIFEFATSTPLFNPDSYLFVNRNAKSRIRDAKRKTYREFLEWCADPNIMQARRPASGWFEFPKDKSIWLPELRTKYPDFARGMDAVIDRRDRLDMARAMLNGERAAKLTGLSGLRLGELMRDIRAPHRVHGSPEKNVEALVSWVLEVGQEGVDAEIRRIAGLLNQGRTPDQPGAVPQPSRRGLR